MKNIILVILIFLFSLHCKGQSSFEVELYKIDSCINENLATGNYDSIDLRDTEFQTTLFNYLSKNKNSIREKFEYLKRNNILNILTSKDGKFRLYNWDTRTGGTMHFYQAIFQYETTKGIKTEILVKSADESLCYYDRIEEVIINKQTYYLLIGRGRYSNQDFGTSLTNFTILNNKLIATTKLFQPKGKPIEEIFIPYNWFQNVDLEQDPEKVFVQFADNMKTLSIAIIDEQGKFTKKYFKYKLENGKYRF